MVNCSRQAGGTLVFKHKRTGSRLLVNLDERVSTNHQKGKQREDGQADRCGGGVDHGAVANMGTRRGCGGH